MEGFTFNVGNQALIYKESMLIESIILYDRLYKVNLDPSFAQSLFSLYIVMNVGMSMVSSMKVLCSSIKCEGTYPSKDLTG